MMSLKEYPTSGDTAADTEGASTAPAPAAALPAGDFITPALDALWPSPTNPRQHFDADKLQQLADSIRAGGVHTPILLRPMPAKYLADTTHLRPRPDYEIVAGARRYRASRLAGMQTIPALVRDLTDVQVLEIQLTENLQRDDLTPLEEANGYARVIAETSIPKEAIGERIGKSRSYVYGRLKLLELIPDGRSALGAGKLNASVAEKIARVPDAKLQAKALKEATETDYYDAPRHSFKSFCEWLDKHVMLPLGKARFTITDASLVPAAGACSDCPKRTGANPELFADVKGADICTDPACFHAKEDAHDAAIVAKAAERGQQVITGKEAKEILPYEHREQTGNLEGYKRLDKPDARTGSGKALKTLLGKDAPTPILLQSPHTGQLIEVLPTAIVNRLLKDKEYIDARQARAKHDIRPEQREREEAEAFERKWRLSAIEQMHALMRIDGPPSVLPAPLAHSIGKMLLGGLTQDERGHIARVLGIGKVASADGLDDHLSNAGEANATAAMLLILMEHDTRNIISYSETKPGEAKRINAIADAMDFDVAAVKRQVRADLDSEAKAAAAPAPAAAGAPVKYRCPSTGATWTGRGKKPRWIEIALEDGRKLEEFAQGDLLHAPAAQASTTRGAKAQGGKSPAARARDVTPPKRKATAQETMHGIAAAMQGIEASALADAATVADAAATPSVAGDTTPGSAAALQGIEASALADAGPTASLVQSATELVVREQKASVRLLKSGLAIGTTVAMRLMTVLEQAGTVGACDERGARKVLVAA